MTRLMLAFALIMAGIVAMFLSLTAVGLDSAIAGSIAATLVGGVPYLHQTLERHEGRRVQSLPAVLSYEGFRILPFYMLVYATFLMTAAIALGSALGGATVAAVGGAYDSLMVGAVIFSLFVTLPLVFCIGRWMGRRSTSYGVQMVIFAAFISRIIVTISEITLVSSDELSAIYGQVANIQFFFFQILGGTITLSAFGLLGYWRGRRQRLSAYLNYLLGRVSHETQKLAIHERQVGLGAGNGLR